MIFVPKYKDIYTKEPIGFRTEFAGHYVMEAYNPETKRSRKLAEFDNMMLTAGLNRMGTRTDMTETCKVGTGTTPPLASDNNVETPIANGESAGVNSGTPSVGAPTLDPPWAAYTKVYSFPQALEGTLSEVAVGPPNSTGQPCLSRALILDGGGSPTTITVLTIEILVVTFTLKCYGTAQDQLMQTTIGGILYDVIIRMADIGATSTWSWPWTMVGPAPGAGYTQISSVYNGNIGLITTAPSGTGFYNIGGTNAAYSENSFQKDFSWSLGSTVANLSGGIRSFLVGTNACGAWQMQFNGPSDEYIQKDNTKTLDLTFRVSWGAH